MLPNTATPSRVLVADSDTAFHATITALTGIENVITTTVGDQWPQDAWEFGIVSVPYQTTAAVSFETLRDGRPLEAWGRTNLLGPTPSNPNRTGFIEMQANGTSGQIRGVRNDRRKSSSILSSLLIRSTCATHKERRSPDKCSGITLIL